MSFISKYNSLVTHEFIEKYLNIFFLYVLHQPFVHRSYFISHEQITTLGQKNIQNKNMYTFYKGNKTVEYLLEQIKYLHISLE